MPNSNYSTDGKVGVRIETADSTAEKSHALGETTVIQGGRLAMYVLAGEILSASAAVAVNASFTASASAGGYIAVASANAGQYLWVRTSAAVG